MSKSFTNHNGDVYTWDEDAGRYLLEEKKSKAKKSVKKSASTKKGN